MRNKDVVTFCISIIIIGAIIAAGIFYVRKNNVLKEEGLSITDSSNEELNYTIAPITEKDHIIGNPNAPVVMIQYSDFECPMCREFYPVVLRLIEDYGKTGQFALVYRHFPVEEVSGNENSVSKIAAIASECVKDLGGESLFWNFTFGIYEKLNINFQKEDLEKLAVDIGIDRSQYNRCLTSDKFEQKIQSNIDDGLAIYKKDRNFGTPYNILVFRNGRTIILPGVQPYSVISQLIELYAPSRI